MHTTAPADATPVGSTIGGKYRVVRLLGVGGMGSVYEAENNWTGRRVAVKVLRAEYTHNEEFAKRFMFEGRQAARIGHPNVVDVLDMGQDPANGSLFIVQELLTGVDLRTRLQREKRLAPREAAQLILPVMHALAAAHDSGVLHRDVKPENIFLSVGSSGDVAPKLIDFGISKPLAGAPDSGVSMTATGFAMGTARYMSPEQARGDIQLDARSDVWAIGTVLYETLCGRPPFVAPTDTLLLTKLLTESPPRIELFAPEIPRELADVVHGALTPDRAKRYRTMREFVAALEGCACLRADAPTLRPPAAAAALADDPTQVDIAGDRSDLQHSDVHPSAAARRASEQELAQAAAALPVATSPDPVMAPLSPAANAAAERPAERPAAAPAPAPPVVPSTSSVSAQLDLQEVPLRSRSSALVLAFGGLAVLAAAVALVTAISTQHTREPPRAAVVETPPPAPSPAASVPSAQPAPPSPGTAAAQPAPARPTNAATTPPGAPSTVRRPGVLRPRVTTNRLRPGGQYPHP